MESKIDHPPKLDTDLGLQTWIWRLQRVVWVLLAVFLAAALAGLLGNGLLSSAEARAGRLAVKYDRFLHRTDTTTLSFTLASPVLRLDANYLEGLEVEEITPEPVETTRDGGDVVYRFASADRVVIRARVRDWGVLHGRAAAGGDQVRFRHLSYP